MFYRRKFCARLAVSIAVLALNVCGVYGQTRSTNQPVSTNGVTVGKTGEQKTPKTLSELLALPPEEVEKLDIGLLNLLCAEGLRGSEELNLETCLRTLETLAEHVKTETERNRHYFQESPEKFKNSEGYFRMFYLATILQQDFGVQYNPARKEAFVQENGKTVRKQSDDVFYADSKDSFIHGLLTYKHYGTCASMPVLYVAVAKRLGYPVFFATTQAHGYVRYEEGNGQHFNVEATCVGFKTYPDEFFKRWPFPVSDVEIKEAYHLQSLNNKIVLGRFLIGRASNLTAAKEFDAAAEAWRQAMRYLPDTATFKKYADQAQDRAHSEAQKSKWFALWNELGQLRIPDGKKLSYFQNKRVRIQTLMANSADVDGMERAVNSLKHELTAYKMAADSAFPVQVDTWPETAPEIEHEAVLPELTRLKALVPELRTIPLESIPPEYIWFGMPQDLQERLHCLLRDGDVIDEMRVYQVEEMQMQKLATREAANRRMRLANIQDPMWRPVRRQYGERFELRKYFRDSYRIPTAYRQYADNAPPEIEELIVSLRFSSYDSFDDRERKILNALREYSLEQSDRQWMLHGIKKRRGLLQMEVERRRVPGRELPQISLPQMGIPSPFDEVQHGAAVWGDEWLRQETERRLSEIKSFVSGRQSSLTPKPKLPINAP